MKRRMTGVEGRVRVGVVEIAAGEDAKEREDSSRTASSSSLTSTLAFTRSSTFKLDTNKELMYAINSRHSH
jgi:hypothetical protein